MPEPTYAAVTADTERILERPRAPYWLAVLGLLFLACCLFGAWGFQLARGLGVTGLGNPVGWGTYITTMVFWIGIGHAGTLISAILFLLRARFRTAIYRVAEATTIFALCTAGLFPLIHLGRVWTAFYLFPYPSGRGLWPNFRSPLEWDVLAISTYLTISTIFFLVGLVPDLATLRDRSIGLKRRIYGLLSLGFEGTDRQWRHYTAGYLLFAALATPLVISVHSVVSWDFAMSVVPGWHTTIFAPYFVAGAILSGLAMVMTVVIPLRKLLRIEHIITGWHIEQMAKLTLFVSLIVGYAYAVENFIAWYSGQEFEEFIFAFRAFGDSWWVFWIMVVCNVLVPLLFFSRRVRTNLPLVFLLSILINVGMWFERFNIIVSSLSREYLPFAWGDYHPGAVELIILLGSFGLFFLLVLLFVKHLPAIATTELKEAQEPPRAGTALAREPSGVEP